jgi:hypothetical protein
MVEGGGARDLKHVELELVLQVELVGEQHGAVF